MYNKFAKSASLVSLGRYIYKRYTLKHIFFSLFLVILGTSHAGFAKDKSYVLEPYKSYKGEWAGTLRTVSGTKDVIRAWEDDPEIPRNIGLRIKVDDGENVEVYFRHGDNSPWVRSDGVITYTPDLLGFHVHIAREGGVWLERVWISVARLKEDSAQITYTRTVHNWKKVEGETAGEFGSIFGIGNAKKI